MVKRQEVKNVTSNVHIPFTLIVEISLNLCVYTHTHTHKFNEKKLAWSYGILCIHKYIYICFDGHKFYPDDHTFEILR